MVEVLSRRAPAQPYRAFEVDVLRRVHLSPSFLRVTFTGVDLDLFADRGFDQRIKLVLPLPRSGLDHFPQGPDWYARWRALPQQWRNPVRTYTVRAVRPRDREIDVDFVLHGHGGPFSRWASTTSPGARVAVIGPDARFRGEHGGADFRPPEQVRKFLLAGDETAVPAISAILQRLPPDSRGQVVLEVPLSSDVLPIASPPGMHLRWLGRDGAPHGSLLVPTLKAVAPTTLRLWSGHRDADTRLSDPDVDTELLWDVPEVDAHFSSDVYAWLAGEAGVIKSLRRHLVGDLGLDRRSVAFMGYWRLGRSQIGS